MRIEMLCCTILCLFYNVISSSDFCYSILLTCIMSKVDVVMGSQWGDEGKGKLVDTIGDRYGAPQNVTYA